MQFRLIAGTHVGPDSKGVVRMWVANSKNDIIDTEQDLSTLNTRGFPPKFQPLHEAPADEASLLAKKAEIEAALARIERDKSGQTPVPVAPLAGAPVAPPMIQDPRSTVSPAAEVKAARTSANSAVINAAKRMPEEELREFLAGEEIHVEPEATREEMLEAVERVYG